MQDESSRGVNQGAALPLTVRRALWERVWDRLLAPGPPAQADAGGGRQGAASGPDAAGEGR
jgi:hypothetical protein